MKALRTCKVCGKAAHTEQELGEFATSPVSTYGRANICKLCKAQKDRDYNMKHREKIREKVRAKYQALPAETRSEMAKRHLEARKTRWTIEERRTQAYYAHIKHKYGLTKEAYHQMLEVQKNRCPICSDHFDEKRSHVDHNHETGEVRGILCNNCNSLLGLAKDTTEKLKQALGYLETYGSYGY